MFLIRSFQRFVTVDLYQEVILHPSKYRKICQEFVANGLIIRLMAKKMLPLMRISLLVHCTAPPVEIVKAESPGALKGPLIMLEGYILIGRSTPVIYKPCSLYICQDWNCRGRVTYLEDTDETPATENGMCPVCSRRRKEYVIGRGEGERVMANFVILKALKPELGKRYQGQMCSITDSLIKDLELGVEYDLWGRHEMRWFEVWGIRRHVYWPVSLSSVPLPPKIQILKNSVDAVCPNSPWAFVSSLASQLACGFCPSSSFMHLKMGSLLSLATLSRGLPVPIMCIGSDTEAAARGLPVPIMCIGPDTEAAANIMNYAAELAPRHLPIRFPAGGTATRKPTDDHVWMESGVLTMTRTGVCTVGEWEILKPAHSQAILTTVSDGLITMDTKMGHVGPVLPLVPKQPLRSAIWTYWGYYKWDSQKNRLENLVDKFGVPFLADANDDDPYIRYMLEKAMDRSLYQKELKQSVPADEFTQYLSMANSLSVELGEEAEQLIKQYYVASRRVRGDCMPARSNSIMIALAKSHARLNLRTEATREDVVAVIILYEEALCHIHSNAISTPPSFKVCPIQDINKKMFLFNKWLNRYLEKVIGGSHLV